jgi:peptide deformylase
MNEFPRPQSIYLRVFPDCVLRQVCEPVERYDSWLWGVLEEMVLVMQAHDGIGLAAPQVGIVKRFFVAQIHQRTLCLMNPTIISRCGTAGMTEGCLSLPDTLVHVQRNAQIEVHGFDLQGQRQTYRERGFWARVIQHEMDHLNGILISDHAR